MKPANQSAAKQKRGRPNVDTSPISVRLRTEVIQDIDDWRREQRDLPGRPEAIRRLIERALRKRP